MGEEFFEHLILYEIQTAKVCPYRLLFDEDFMTYFKQTDEFKYSNIYLFCRNKRIRFNLDKTYLRDKRTLKTELLIGKNKTREVTANFFELSSLFRQIYGTKDEYHDLVSDEDDYWECKFLKNKSDNKTLLFNQIAQLEDQVFDFQISPENYEFDLDLKLNNHPEIIYIGQSFRMLDRIRSHETLHKAVSKLTDSEELKIYFLTFKYGYGGNKDKFDQNGDVFDIWLSKHGKDKRFKSKIDLVERFLIHFFKPEYNKQHAYSQIQNDTLVKKILRENKISTVTVNYGMHGNGFQFWSANQALNSDICTFDFNSPELGYYKGLVPN
ncbi:MAG: hypothetical protein JJU13_08365 [Balneolaceae bacterium]|nr:hypothetical protein [Balneolaceae bacterium]